MGSDFSFKKAGDVKMTRNVMLDGEELLLCLKTRCTLLIVSHYLDQVRRVADNVFELKSRQRLHPIQKTV